MPALARRTKQPSTLDTQLLSGLHVALEDFAKGLVDKLTALIGEQLGESKAGTKRLEKQVEALVPLFLEQEFVVRFLADKDSARHHRALLAHLFTATDLQNFSGLPVTPLASLAELLPSGVDDEDGGEEVTSEEAARLLHVSRTHVNTLADSGKLGVIRQTAGGHRRLSKAAVMRYKTQSKARQAKGLKSMEEATARMGLYDDELVGIPVRSKR